jgi:asparagine synthase (glutamine-hydrolysing)
VQKSWYEYIKDHVETVISDESFENSNNKFISKEAMWYRNIFDSYFPTYQLDMYYWMPKWCNAKDPSGRVTGAYDEKQ